MLRYPAVARVEMERMVVMGEEVGAMKKMKS
jgi:hypothetical protein